MNGLDTNPLVHQLFDTTAFEIPDPPDAFGQDGGKFYRCYDAFANEIDEDKVKGLKEQLDGLLIFVCLSAQWRFILSTRAHNLPSGSLQAGLFAGINTTFLSLTLPALSKEPTDFTNALIAQNSAISMLLVTGRNDTMPPVSDFETPFEVPLRAVIIVALLSMSLTFALMASFIAVLGRQWLIYYRKRSGGGPDRHRWDQLRRFLGAERWRLELILDDILPSFLQIGLLQFCIALMLFLNSINQTVAMITMIPIAVGLGFFAFSVTGAMWDKFCPFQSPISHFAFTVFRMFVQLGSSLIASSKFLCNGFIKIIDQPRHTCNSLLDAIRHTRFGVRRPSRWQLLSFFPDQQEETVSTLQVIALERVVCTSEDPASLLCAVAQIPCITNVSELRRLWKEDAFRESLLELYTNSYSRNLQLKATGQISPTLAARRLYVVAVTHFLLYLDLPQPYFDLVFPHNALSQEEGFKDLGMWNVEYAPGGSQIFVQTSLSHSIISMTMLQPTAQDVETFCEYLSNCSEALTIPNWRLLCLICWTIAQLPRIKSLHSTDLGSMAVAFRGDIDPAPATIEKALKVLSERNHGSSLDKKKILTNLLICCSQVVAGGHPHPKLGIDQRLILLRSVEEALRTTARSDELEDLVGKMRRSVVAQFRTECFREDSSWGPVTALSKKVFEALISVFAALQEAGRAQRSRLEGAEVVRVLGPLVRDITSNDAVFDWGGEICNIADAPESLQELIDRLRETFGAVTSDSGADQEVQ
ncbi:hypothetical protein FRC01_006822, partial [Tulasnella sp. 417]